MYQSDEARESWRVGRVLEPEIKAVLVHAKRDSLKVFGLKADIKKAHRRCRVRQEDWGFQACKVEEGRTWLNEVGTFGIGSAAYWWGRAAAARAAASGAPAANAKFHAYTSHTQFSLS